MAWVTGMIFVVCLGGIVFGSLVHSAGAGLIWAFIGGLVLFISILRWLQFKLESITDRNFFCDLFEVPIE